MTRLIFGVSIRDPITWYDLSDPVLCAAGVPLVSTPWRLAAIGHLGLHILGCRGWIVTAKYQSSGIQKSKNGSRC